MNTLLPDEDATLAFGAQLASFCPSSLLIYLHGDLGAGKTTLVRGFIHHFMPTTRVKSPTYTLVEPYEIPENQRKIKNIYHFDLYRMADPEELEYMGGRDYFSSGVCLVEWPERGKGWLPEADLEISLHYAEGARTLELSANSKRGAELMAQLK